MGKKKTRQTQTITGDETQTGTITNTPIIPQSWSDLYGGATENIGATGFTGPQQQGLDALSGLVGYNPAQAQLRGAQAGLQGARGAFAGAPGSAKDTYASAARGFGIARGDVRSAGEQAQNALTRGRSDVRDASQQIGDITRDYTQAYADRGSNTLGAFFPDAPEIVGGQVRDAQIGNVQNVNALQGSQIMSDYMNPYQQQVVQPTVDILRGELEQQLNRQKMASAGGGALGGGRQQVAEQAALENYGAKLAREVGGLQARGFETAAGLGQTDASRFLQAGMGDQRTQLQRALAQGDIDRGSALRQAELDQQANLQRARMMDERQRFDIGQADIGDQRRMQAIRDMVGQRELQAQLGAEGAELGAAGAQAFGDAAFRGAQLGGQQGDAALAAARAGAEGAGLGVQAANLGLTGSALTSEDAMNLIESGAIGPEQLAILLQLGTSMFGEEELRDIRTRGTDTLEGTTTRGGGLGGFLGNVARIGGTALGTTIGGPAGAAIVAGSNV
jgi:hypothetical protein